jgi:hypothetical protein
VSIWDSLRGKTVVLKLDFLDRGIKAQIIGTDDATMWITSPELEKNLSNPAKQVAAAMMEVRYYIPIARVQFVQTDSL